MGFLASDENPLRNRQRLDIVAASEGRRRLDTLAFYGLLNEPVLKGRSTQSLVEEHCLKYFNMPKTVIILASVQKTFLPA